MNRREVLLGAGACTLARAPLASAATDGLMTAADVHVDKYPTVEAVRWMGRKLEAADPRPPANPRVSRGPARTRRRYGRSDPLRRARYHARELRSAEQRLSADPGVCIAVRVRFRGAHASRCRWRRRADECSKASRTATWSGSRSTMPDRAPSTTRSAPIHEPKDLHGLKIRVPPSDIFLDDGPGPRRQSHAAALR